MGLALPRWGGGFGKINADGEIDLPDAVHMLRYLYLGSATPAEPFEECGEDATSDDLKCESFPPCE